MNIDVTQLEQLGGLVADGLVFATSDGEVISATPTACTLLGLPPGAQPASVAGMLADSLSPIDETHTLEPPLRRAAHAAFQDEDVCCACADGCVRRLRLAGCPLGAPAGTRVVVLVLRELQEPPPIAEPLPLDTELRRLQELRDEILSIASHELKNPLTVVLGYGAVLAGAPQVRATPRLARAAEAIRAQSQRMRRLVDQLLDFSRLGLGRLTLQRSAFDIADQVRAVAEKHLSASNQVRVAVEGAPFPVVGDAMRLERVLASLVAGAARHGGEGADVTVSLRRVDSAQLPSDAYGAAIRPGPYALVRVLDPGLSSVTDPHRLFAQYNPDDGYDSPQADHWLSLYVGAQLVALHGGLIWAELHAPSGGLICYAVPLSRPRRAAEPHAPPEPATDGV